MLIPRGTAEPRGRRVFRQRVRRTQHADGSGLVARGASTQEIQRARAGLRTTMPTELAAMRRATPTAHRLRAARAQPRRAGGVPFARAVRRGGFGSSSDGMRVPFIAAPLVAVTDSRGRGLCPCLRPWHKNDIEACGDLPMDAELVESRGRSCSGAAYSGRFDVRRTRQACCTSASDGKPCLRGDGPAWGQGP